MIIARAFLKAQRMLSKALNSYLRDDSFSAIGARPELETLRMEWSGKLDAVQRSCNVVYKQGAHTARNVAGLDECMRLQQAHIDSLLCGMDNNQKKLADMTLRVGELECQLKRCMDQQQALAETQVHLEGLVAFASRNDEVHVTTSEWEVLQ